VAITGPVSKHTDRPRLICSKNSTTFGDSSAGPLPIRAGSIGKNQAETLGYAVAQRGLVAPDRETCCQILAWQAILKVEEHAYYVRFSVMRKALAAKNMLPATHRRALAHSRNIGMDYPPSSGSFVRPFRGTSTRATLAHLRMVMADEMESAVAALIVQYRIERMARRVGWVATGLGLLLLIMLLMWVFRINP
jgi:hypothetical protein